MVVAASQESLLSKKKKDIFNTSKSGSLHRSPSKESINSLGSVGSDSSFFSGGQSKFAEVCDFSVVLIESFC